MVNNLITLLVLLVLLYNAAISTANKYINEKL
jgi:hypothetical protein